jgi:hypothetical protein
MDLSGTAGKLLDGLAKKKLSEVKDAKVRQYLTDVWGGLLDKAPELFDTLVGPGEVILKGKHLNETKRIMSLIQDDIVAFKNKAMEEAEFRQLVMRRKAAIFALYNAQKISDAKISVQKVLSAAEMIAEILIKAGIPFLLAAL